MYVDFSQTVWHVRVHTDDELRTEDYWFRTKSDVLTSIRTTWSKTPEAITVIDDGTQIEVHSTDHEPNKVGRLLVACHQKNGVRVLDGPTHF